MTFSDSFSEVGVIAATVEVRRMMDGDPHKVYELIADVTRMVEWSPESAGAEWLTGEPGTVGSTFRGDNRRPWMKWSTNCTVIAADPGKRADLRSAPPALQAGVIC